MADNRRREEQVGENHICIEVEEANKLLADKIRRKIQSMPSSQCCIFKVPEKLRKVKEDAYVPEIVSIGPFHHGKDSLQAMEEHKKWYLHALLLSPSSKSLEDLIKAIRALEVDAREYYAEPINLNSDEFVEMMLLDGCFILQFLYYHGNEKLRINNDPIFNAYRMLGSILHDMILLENQLPFIVIEHLFKLTRGLEQGSQSIDELVSRLFDIAIAPTIGKVVPGKSSMEGKHLLDKFRNKLIFRASSLQKEASLQKETRDHHTWEFTNTATDLETAGVNFKKKNAADGLLDITFSKDGVFEIPPFYFNDVVHVLLRNLIALEFCEKDKDNDKAGQITSYVVLLDSLINSQKDVRLLRQKRIIESYFGDDEEVALIIHQLCTGIGGNRFHYDGLCRRVNAYYRTDWHKWRSTLKRDYFNTPWAILSFSAAIALLLLTLTQTIFSILH